jgi:hypothetical protein
MILNPENIPKSAIPEGWRFLETTDLPINRTPCRVWYEFFEEFSCEDTSSGDNPFWTYIVPKEAPEPPIKVNLNSEMHHALQEVFFLVQGSADGAPDATDHNKLCNQILEIVRSFV